ncbi:hypothetical protein F1188_14500 [Roseospira marina]|uniref:Uncharacterized protein n=1 Tax=Roseospira marina TaxID=140057 RepID=A0A5M6I969_9PROT|nr:hypothetical protein [Roseospira marina]KAA5604816.1 hypothetical protein F1188_14500 [Roseospira marina]MBB4313507.1 hypothetical protein [Roseospira marina]MBB5086669.1 hypothetical protein [Roseospira marina]
MRAPFAVPVENRLAEIRHLVASGLPTYRFHVVPLHDFQTDATGMAALFARYGDAVVVRAVPGDRHGQRLTRIGARYDTCRAAFADLEPSYSVIVNEYDPARYCGIAVTVDSGLLIEMVAEANLEGLAHGRAIPWHARFAGYAPGSSPLLRSPPGTPEAVRARMWRAVLALSVRNADDGALPHFVPRTGYFEFVFSARTDSLRFIDCRE